FNKMAESLQREEELRKHLFSNVAHELRTPLTILKTHAEAIADGVIDREKGLGNIKNEIDRLIRLVKGIEDITMAEASFFTKGETVEINLREFLLGICNEMLPAFKQIGLDITKLRADVLFVCTGMDKLEKIARNIISNSLKFTPLEKATDGIGGKIPYKADGGLKPPSAHTVRERSSLTGFTEKGGVSIDYGIEGEMYFIEIMDSGRGIPENEMPLIFNRFYRGAKSDTESLGLGLEIVKELVEVMGGRVEVKSIIDDGTTFRVSLPIKGV
ncbi:two-component system, NtrC family, sensor kinase, partial [Candidatus Hakubella thermalkaliphila]